MTRAYRRPTALKLLHGERADRINHDEPQPGEGVPDCPSGNPLVRDVWDYTIGQLKTMRTITMADRDALAAYCEAVVQHRVCAALLAKDGLVIGGSHGGLVRHPAAAIQRECAALIRGFGADFGLSPAARSRVKVADQQPAKEQGASRLLSG